jgi:hypothetical protein
MIVKRFCDVLDHHSRYIADEEEGYDGQGNGVIELWDDAEHDKPGRDKRGNNEIEEPEDENGNAEPSLEMSDLPGCGSTFCHYDWREMYY